MLSNLGSGIKLLPAAAIMLGALLILFYTLRHLPEYTRAMTIKVEHPETYRFQTYDELLKKYVKDGLVDYTHLKQDPNLGKAVTELESVSPDNLKGEKERVCFWINSFNLLTLKVICNHYPVTSTDDLSPHWSQERFILGGQPTAVARVSERALLELSDRRIAPVCVFLLCRGSLGYPPLTDHAITPETLEIDAKLAAYKFINNDHNAYYDDEKLDFYLSPLFKRYEPIIRRSRFDPHKFALLQMNGKNVPSLENLMITKTYFKKLDPMLNDQALAPRKEEE